MGKASRWLAIELCWQSLYKMAHFLLFPLLLFFFSSSSSLFIHSKIQQRWKFNL